MAWLARDYKHSCEDLLPGFGNHGPHGGAVVVGDKYACEGKDIWWGRINKCNVVWEVVAVGPDSGWRQLSWRRYGTL